MGFSKIDYFSSSFSFNIGGQKVEKGTIQGSIFTLIVIAFSTSHFIYLFQLYLQNEIEPIYRAQNIINNSTQSLDIDQNIYAYKIGNLIENTNLMYTYLDIQGQLNNGTQVQNVTLQTKDCIDPNLQGFQCLDQIKYTNNKQKEIIENKSNKYKLTQLFFFTYSCFDNKQDISKCAPESQIKETLNSSQITLKLSLSQFNIKKQKMDQTFQTVQILTSADQVKITQIKLQNQYVSVKQGPFIQSEQSSIAPFSYTVDNQNLNRQFITQNFAVSPYSLVNLLVDQIHQSISIQYPTFPTILAQVNSVFSILLFLGYFMKCASFNSIQQEFFLVLMKNVYQEAYQKVIKLNNFYSIKNQKGTNQKKQKKDEKNNLQNQQQKAQTSMQQQANEQIDNKKTLKQPQIQEIQEQINFNKDIKSQNQTQTIIIAQSILDINQMKYQSENSNLKNQSIGPRLIDLDQAKAQTMRQSVISSQEQLEDKDICKIQLQFIDKSIELKTNDQKSTELAKSENSKKIDKFIKKIIFGFKLFKKNEFLKSKGIDINHKKKIEEQLIRDLDILQIYKDIIFLKKSIMVLLTQDQLASINYMGCSLDILNKNQSALDIESDQCNFIYNLHTITIIENKKIKLVCHYEKQFVISNSEDLQYFYAQSFLQRCNDKSKISQIDERILNSICKSYSN